MADHRRFYVGDKLVASVNMDHIGKTLDGDLNSLREVGFGMVDEREVFFESMNYVAPKTSLETDDAIVHAARGGAETYKGLGGIVVGTVSHGGRRAFKTEPVTRIKQPPL